ncbi:AAA family ATPase [Lentibacillus sediminis]|uniref:AAA family ATPase n=1 Tax=Lentibacillus sediminis TaxID=1940529 RepID=UPI000C1B8AE8|nr:AAA family ATPase [Lentibacillus sediminis]
MAVNYKLKESEKQAIYGAAEKWKYNCLLDDKSLIWEGESIWTVENMSRFRSIFIERPDEPGDSFDDKLKKQLSNESEDVYKFVIELLFIYYLFPSKKAFSYKTKIRKLETIASWKDIEIDTSLPVFNAFKKGIGMPGVFYSASKYFEVSFLFSFAEYLKIQLIEKRKVILEQPEKLKQVAEEVRSQVGKRVQMQHIILHLLLPGYFERIASWGHKERIVKAYANLIEDGETNDLDKQLYIIREKLEDEYGTDQIDFYETPGIAEMWRTSASASKEKLNNEEEQIDDTILIKIGVSYKEDMLSVELYNATSQAWKLSKRKLESGNLRYFCAVYNNQIKEVYELKDYKKKGERYALEGTKADKQLRNKLLNVDVSQIHTSAGNPIKYTSIQRLLDKGVYDAEEVKETLGNRVQIPTVNFDVEPVEDGLVFENIDVLMDQVKTALQYGKHIILTGPPGTGKSKLASRICKMYDVNSTMVTAASNWSTYETIGGYFPDKEGHLYFNEGIFLNCVKDKVTNKPKNNWLIIDEINRADIDKAFGSLFSVLTGDEITLPFESKSGEMIQMKPQGTKVAVEPKDHTYIIPKDWRIIGTMNTIDKASLYEMSYAFMRRFAFIPVGIPKTITNDLIEEYLEVWDMETYPNVETLTAIWKLINAYRKIGPAIIRDIAMHTQDNDDFTSAIILYVLPQFEGLSVHRIKEFIAQVTEDTDAVIEKSHLDDFANDFFDVGAFE